MPSQHNRLAPAGGRGLRRVRRAFFAICGPAAVLCLALSGAMFAGAPGGGDSAVPGAAAEDDESLDGVRAALEQWVETRRVISKETRDWALGREMLGNRIDLVDRESQSLRERIADAEDSIAEADKKRADLIAENDRLKAASAALVATVTALEKRTLDLLRRLPDPICERVKPLSQRIPDDSKDAKLSLSERFMNIVGILNAVNKFNREITVTSEVRTLRDGTAAEVTALYVGISHGYYASSDGRAAGVGTPTDEGWVWTAANEAAPQILQVIKILKNEQAASFVRLPVRVD